MLPDHGFFVKWPENGYDQTRISMLFLEINFGCMAFDANRNIFDFRPKIGDFPGGKDDIENQGGTRRWTKKIC